MFDPPNKLFPGVTPASSQDGVMGPGLPFPLKQFKNWTKYISKLVFRHQTMDSTSTVSPRNKVSLTVA